MKKQERPTQEEIDEHLRELNIATSPADRKKKSAWFSEQKIRIMLIETMYYVVPEEINADFVKEFMQHLHQANLLVKALSIELAWFKEQHIKVKLDQKGDVRTYKFVSIVNDENQITSGDTLSMQKHASKEKDV